MPPQRIRMEGDRRRPACVSPPRTAAPGTCCQRVERLPAVPSEASLRRPCAQDQAARTVAWATPGPAARCNSGGRGGRWALSLSCGPRGIAAQRRGRLTEGRPHAIAEKRRGSGTPRVGTDPQTQTPGPQIPPPRVPPRARPTKSVAGRLESTPNKTQANPGHAHFCFQKSVLHQFQRERAFEPVQPPPPPI